MTKTVDSIVQALLEVQKGITAMSAEERILTGERLALALRGGGALNQYTFSDNHRGEYVEIEAGVLRLSIAAEADPYGHIPF
jgi:hypothetical protein